MSQASVKSSRSLSKSLKENKKSSRSGFMNSQPAKKSSKSDRSIVNNSSKSSKDSKKSEKSARKQLKSKREASRSKASVRQKRADDGKDEIRIVCGTDKYKVKSKDFAACSALVKRELEGKTHPRTVDLSKYEPATAKIFYEFITNKEVRSAISFYSIAELLKLARVFEMEDLSTQLNNFVLEQVSKDTTSLHQILLILGLTSFAPHTEQAVLTMAAAKFVDLASSPDFQQIPFKILIAILSRCDLKVKSEVQVADAALFWLAGQTAENLPNFAPAVFSLIRHSYIHPMQKAFIVERSRALHFPDEAVNAVTRSLENGNGGRLCMSADHIKEGFARCRTPSFKDEDAKQPELPLSLPRDGIFYNHSKTSPHAYIPNKADRKSAKAVKSSLKKSAKSRSKSSSSSVKSSRGKK